MKPFLNSEKPIDVICMGRVAVDLYAEDIGSPLAEVKTFRKYLGGCAGNIAVGSSRLGLKSAMFSCIGNDAMGDFLHQELSKEKVDISLLAKTDKHLTGLVLLGITPPDHFPLMFYRENCADMQLAQQPINREKIANAKALLITGTNLSQKPMYDLTQDVINLCKSLQMQIILDLDYRPVLWQLTQAGDGETRFKACEKVSKTYQSILSQCDLIVGTEEEFLIAGNNTHLNQALQTIRAQTKAPLVVKKGVKGCDIYFDDDTHLHSPAFPVEVLNVLGAGDAFMSGLLRGLLRGETWETAATFANAAGAILVTKHGCAPAMPYFSELLDFIKENNHVRISHS